MMAHTADDFLEWDLMGVKFTVPDAYSNLAAVGFGRFGSVCSADLHLPGNNTTVKVAIKRIADPFSSAELAKRSYRELAILRRLNHENVLCLVDAFVSPSDDLYLATRYVKGELRRMLQGNKTLSIDTVRLIMYRLLNGLAYLHSRAIVHRDLKPENILIDPGDPQTLAICDLGLARPAEPHMTGYIATRYYRAPEVMLTWREYDGAVDLWSAGCIMAEALTGRVLLPGADHVHHLRLIIGLLGRPPPAVVARICSEPTRRYLLMLPAPPADSDESIKHRLAGIEDPMAVDLITKLLMFDPAERPTASQALQHPFFNALPLSPRYEYDPIVLVEEQEAVAVSQWRDLILKACQL